LESGGWLGNVKSLSQEIRVTNKSRPFGKYFRHWDMDGPSFIPASITPFGKGQIAAVYLNIGNGYLNRSTPVMRDFLDALIKEMKPSLMTDVSGSHLIDVTLNRLNNALIINLVNSGGPHDNDKIMVFDEIPALGPIQISLRYPAKPNRVTTGK
jgi:hypothetical protein